MFKLSALKELYREGQIPARTRGVIAAVIIGFAGLILVLCLPITGQRDTNLVDGQTVQNPKSNLNDQLRRLCWIAYSPSRFDPTTRPVRWPSEDDVRQDLRVLSDAGFKGLVTYGCDYRNQAAPDQTLDITGLAEKAGFEGMIVGVWNPSNEDELREAEKAGHNRIVIGYCVGNEGLDVRYDLKTLTSTMERLRRVTGKPVSTSEEVGDYSDNSPLWQIADWTFPNVHPYFAKLRDPQRAVKWTEEVFRTLRSVSNKPLIFKEVGLPSSGDYGLSQSHQSQYYQLLRKTEVIYVTFEAFDAPWKHLGSPRSDGTHHWPDPEPHWGVFTSARKPKEAAAKICSLRQNW